MTFVLFYRMMQCSLAQFVPSIQCAAHGVILPLSACHKNIQGHLRSCHLSADTNLQTESSIILARAGLFDADPSLHTVCATHRYRLCIGWSSTSKTCRVPVGTARYYLLSPLNSSAVVS